MAESWREPEEGPRRHEGRNGDGPGQEGAFEALYPARGGGFSATAADGLHRSVSGPRRRSGDAVGGDTGSLCATDPAGGGSGDRGLELHRRPPAAGKGEWASPPTSRWPPGSSRENTGRKRTLRAAREANSSRNTWRTGGFGFSMRWTRWAGDIIRLPPRSLSPG